MKYKIYLEAPNRMLCERLGQYGDAESLPRLYTDYAGMEFVIGKVRELFNLSIIIDARIGSPIWVRLHRPAERTDKKTGQVERYDAYAGSSTHPELPMAVFLAACSALGIPIEEKNG